MTDKQPRIGDRVKATIHRGDLYNSCSDMCVVDMTGVVTAMGKGLLTIYDGETNTTVREAMVKCIFNECPSDIAGTPSFFDLIAIGALEEASTE